MHALSMTASLMLFWLMISGNFGVLNLSLGLVSSLLVVVISMRMDVVDRESQPIHLTPRLPLYWGWLMLLAMLLAAMLCVFIGIYPQLLYDLLPFPMTYNPYGATHVISQLQLLFFAALAFVWLNLQGLYPPELHAVNLDSDWTYRRFLPAVSRRIMVSIKALDNRFRDRFGGGAQNAFEALTRYHAPQGFLARTWPTGSMALWIAVLLGAYLLAYLFAF